MLYKFKSRATADLIMLEANARQLLQIIGKSPDAHGIVTVAQMPAALEALEAAVSEDQARSKDSAEDEGEEGAGGDKAAPAVHLHQRAAPLIDMLRRSAAEKADVIW
ncbi:DUF1840 domain-containing protein [Paracidovorax wautersii]|uniref:DUF1840 domain-containing protein n=1 Tax=Paracidovorax wautersii TaxID=1177982 RepID=UPI0031DAF825